MHAPMQRRTAPMAEGADTVAITFIFVAHLPQVDCSTARCACHDGSLASDVIVTICETWIGQYALGSDKLGSIRGYCPASPSARLP